MDSYLSFNPDKPNEVLSELPNGSLNKNWQLLLGACNQDCSHSVKIAVGITHGV